MRKNSILLCLLTFVALNSFAQNAVSLTSALDSVTPYLINQIPAKSKILVLNFQTANSTLSNYIVDEITTRLVNSDKFIVVDRRDLDIIRQETSFQMSGEVSDETAAAIGKKIGAQSIIVVRMEHTATLYRLSVRTIEAETAKIQALRSVLVEPDALLALLTKKGKRINRSGQPIGRVLQEASAYIVERVPANTKIAVFNVKTKNNALTNYINDSISESLVNSGKFTVVDRQNHDLLQAEIDFQHSGEASDKTTVSIGKKIGAQSIITGTMEEFGELYRLQIRSIDVESARIQAMRIYLISEDEILGRLTEKEYKKIYIGAIPSFSIHLPNTGGTDSEGEKDSGNFSIDGALSAEFFINEMFSLQTGLLFTSDTMMFSGQKNYYDAFGTVKYSYNTVESFSTQSLIIPLLAGINFYPSLFLLGINGGLYFDIPVKGVYDDSFLGTEDTFKRNILFGWTLGGSAGIKLGPGIIFFNMRYMGDFINAKSTVNNKPVELYKRSIIAFGIGYKIGFINTKK